MPQSVLKTNFLAVRESNDPLRGIKHGLPQWEPMVATTMPRIHVLAVISDILYPTKSPDYISPPCDWERQFSRTLQPLPRIAYTFGSSIYLESILVYTYGASSLPSITPETQELTHLVGSRQQQASGRGGRGHRGRNSPPPPRLPKFSVGVSFLLMSSLNVLFERSNQNVHENQQLKSRAS